MLLYSRYLTTIKDFPLQGSNVRMLTCVYVMAFVRFADKIECNHMLKSISQKCQFQRKKLKCFVFGVASIHFLILDNNEPCVDLNVSFEVHRPSKVTFLFLHFDTPSTLIEQFFTKCGRFRFLLQTKPTSKTLCINQLVKVMKGEFRIVLNIFLFLLLRKINTLYGDLGFERVRTCYI